MPGKRASLPPSNERWYEDYEQGALYDLGTIQTTEEEILSFAHTYDPQPMHIDSSRPEGLIASGWHTASLTMRQIVDHYLSSVAGLPSPGVDAITWSAPVRPNDVISVEAELLEARPSASKPDRGILSTRFTDRNELGIVVMSFQAVNFILRHPE